MPAAKSPIGDLAARLNATSVFKALASVKRSALVSLGTEAQAFQGTAPRVTLEPTTGDYDSPKSKSALGDVWQTLVARCWGRDEGEAWMLHAALLQALDEQAKNSGGSNGGLFWRRGSGIAWTKPSDTTTQGECLVIEFEVLISVDRVPLTLGRVDEVSIVPSPPPSVISGMVMQLTLASATLSGGAQLKSASGGLPNRITVQDDVTLATTGADYSGPMFDPTGAYVWIANTYTQAVKKYDAATGAYTGTSLAYGSMGLFPFDATLFYAADYANNNAREYNWSGTLLNSMAVTSPKYVVRVPGVSGKVWVVPYPSGTVTEYNFPGGTTTGRTLATGLGVSIWAIAGFLFVNDGSVIKKYDEATLTLQATWTTRMLGSAYPGNIFSAPYLATFIVDSTGHPIIHGGLHWNMDRLNTTGGTGAAMVDKRLLYGQPQLGGSGWGSSNGPNPGLSISGNLAAYATDDGSSGFQIIRVKNLFGTQRARWAAPFSDAATISHIMMPGNYCNDRGATYDLRKVRFYWSTDGGGSRTEFTPGSPLSIAVADGGALTIDVDVIEGNGQATNPPYIGGDAGEGPAVVYALS